MTKNNYTDRWPQVSGSNVVWNGEGNLDPIDPSTDLEVFLYDGTTTRQLTNNNYDDRGPEVSGSNVVWGGYAGRRREIFLYDGTTTRQLTNNNYVDRYQQVSGSNVVWAGEGNLDPLDPTTDYEIFLYDGSSTTQITNNSYVDWHPQVSGSNVVWAGKGNLDPLDPTTDYEIFLYDGTTTRQLTNNYYFDLEPEVSGSNVVWGGYDSPDEEIFLYDGTTIRQLTNNDSFDKDFQVSGSNVVWTSESPSSHSQEIFLYDGTTTRELTNEGYSNMHPQVSGSNVAWDGYNNDGVWVFLYDGSTTTQLSNNLSYHQHPDVSGSNVVWYGSEGHDFEIFLAQPASSRQRTHVLTVGVRDDPSGHRGDVGPQKVAAAFRKYNSVGSITSILLDTSDTGNRSRIEDAIHAIKAQLSAGDSFVLYHNGHGMFDLAGEDDEVSVLAQDDANDRLHRVSTTGDERLYLGTETLSDDSFAALFDDPAWDSVDKLFIVSACYSGGFWGSTTAGDSGDLTQLPRAALLASAAEENFSFAAQDSEGFTWGLLGQVLVEALGNLDAQDEITLAELASEVSVVGSEFSGQGNIEGLPDNWGISVPVDFAIQVNSRDDFSLYLVGVPEPSTFALLVTTVVALLVYGCRRRRSY